MSADFQLQSSTIINLLLRSPFIILDDILVLIIRKWPCINGLQYTLLSGVINNHS